MGNGAAIQMLMPKRRYLAGKFPEKCWIDDVWPTIDELFDKLDLDQKTGFELFKVFARIDVEQEEVISIDQVFKYYGGRRSKYTERLFYILHDNDVESPTKMNFVNFSILIWNFCTYRVTDLARHLFEIFDVDMKGQLEKPDLETMYRMMWDCDDHDEYVINGFPFESGDVIKKWEFIDHCNRKRGLIQPAMKFQRRLCNRTGGLLMWEVLARYRVKTFAIHDSQSKTLHDALKVILAYDDPEKRKKRDADRQLKLEMKKMQEEKEKQEQELLELQERERVLAEQKAAQIKEDDWEMKHAWSVFEERKKEFDVTVFYIDQAWDRREARLELYSLLDEAVQLSNLYWEAQDKKHMDFYAHGSAEDQEARFQDYIRTEEGELVLRKTYLTALLKGLLDDVIEWKKKKRKSEFDQSEKELKIRAALYEAENIDVQKKLKAGHGPTKFLEDEEIVAKRYAKRDDFKAAEDKAHRELSEQFNEKNIAFMKKQLTDEQEQRKRDYVRREFDLAMNYGSRITKWELLLDGTQGIDVYINVDTLQQLGASTAICEQCDGIFAPQERNCPVCNALRSAKNLKLYNPMGRF